MNRTPAWARWTALSVMVCLGLPAAAAGARAPGPAIKCWVNKDGLRECGNVVPPEYAQGGHSQVTPSGTVREVEGAKTPEEMRPSASAPRPSRQTASVPPSGRSRIGSSCTPSRPRRTWCSPVTASSR